MEYFYGLNKNLRYIFFNIVITFNTMIKLLKNVIIANLI